MDGHIHHYHNLKTTHPILSKALVDYTNKRFSVRPNGTPLHLPFPPPFESHRVCSGRDRTPLLAGLIERFPPRFHKLAALRVPVDNTPFSPRSYRKRRGNSLLVINVQIATHCSCPDWQSPRPLWMWPSVTRRPATVFSVVHVVEC